MKFKSLINRIFAVAFFIPALMFSQTQVEPVPVVSQDRNWVSSINYDFSGATISKGVSYFNILGKAVQQQNWDVLTGRVWASEIKYDYFNRPALQTLSAPIGTYLGYKSDFTMTGSGVMTTALFDSPAGIATPPTISNQANSLGWYYSTANNLDPYQDVTSYPYTRAVYSELNPGAVKAVVGGNKVTINGQQQWAQAYSFTMPIETGPPNPFYNNFSGKRVMKTVTRDVHGVESVTFSDSDGNMLGAVRSGNEETQATGGTLVISKLLDKGYMDIHIPKGCGGSYAISAVNSNHNVRVFDLITEEVIASNITAGTALNFAPGFYRIEDINNYYGKNNTDANPVNPVSISYRVNYYDLVLNEYDQAGRLLKSTQPMIPMQTTYEYNTLGEVLKVKDSEQGESEFVYRSDGQIRFSQNSEQKSRNSFSYTNYDRLGRPVESGVYTGLGITFAQLSAIADNSDGLPLTGKTEQVFTVYDVPDADLENQIEFCSLNEQIFKQTFLSGNVSYTYTANPFTSKTWYSYDAYGRVTWVIQSLDQLGCVKTVDYEYNPIDGQLVKVYYQRNRSGETLIHKYDYNKAGQLTDVYLSTDDLNFTRQAKYKYNESGALVRTELADKLQGIDYVYNLNGQLKAINHPSLMAANDPGNDGANGFAADVFGMAIDYHTGDYARTGTPKAITTTPQGVDQFNGNIKATRWNTQVPSATQNAYTYQYNKNNWLTQADFGTANASAAFTANASGDYKVSNITYDANGNLQTLKRNGYTDGAGNNAMDNFAYKYPDFNKGNQLGYVTDTGDNTNVNRYNDLKDQTRTGYSIVKTDVNGTSQYQLVNFPNYIYNDLGQMVINQQDKTMYHYNAAGLVDKISVAEPTSTEYQTAYWDDFTNYEWGSWGMISTFRPGVEQPLIPLSQGFPESVLATCPEFGATNQLYGGRALQITGKISVGIQLNVMPNMKYRLNLDAILDKIVDYNGTAVNVEPKLTIRLRKPGTATALGTIFYTQEINSQPAEYCGRYFDEHFMHEFVTGNENNITLEVVSSNNNLSASIGLAQKAFIDNLRLEVAATTKVVFQYNERGQRTRKDSYATDGKIYRTFYVRDAGGNTMAVYTQDAPIAGGMASLAGLAEQTIYGNGRIGLYKKSGKSGSYALYELTDHLGNVRAVIKNSGTGILALTSKADYYPFGMPMPNKQTTDENYRYAFQGQEKDGETGMEAFELRLWDGRLGRWLTVDPKGQYFSPYLGMGNNPISRIDPDGGMDTEPPRSATGLDDFFHDTSDGTYYFGNADGTWTQASTAPITVVVNQKNSSGSSMPIELLLLWQGVKYLDSRLSGHITYGSGSGDGISKSAERDYGSSVGSRGVLYTPLNMGDFTYVGGGGGSLSGMYGSSGKARLVNWGNSAIVSVKGTVGGIQQGGTTVAGMADNSIGAEFVNKTVTVAQYRIHGDTRTVDSVKIKHKLSGTRDYVQKKIDSLKENSRAQRRSSMNYFE